MFVADYLGVENFLVLAGYIVVDYQTADIDSVEVEYTLVVLLVAGIDFAVAVNQSVAVVEFVDRAVAAEVAEIAAGFDFPEEVVAVGIVVAVEAVALLHYLQVEVGSHHRLEAGVLER
ncbi:hypothetical protein HYW87_03875 [Candidatus Roizmanbacteria bacterium]|nr:hypothetical protein [Candidatus Roizmanbacteria bacterium]